LVNPEQFTKAWMNRAPAVMKLTIRSVLIVAVFSAVSAQQT
jgi:hypothetical protein